MKKQTDYKAEYAGKTLPELKKLRTKLLIEASELTGIFSVQKRKETEKRIEAVEELIGSFGTGDGIC